MKDVPSCPVCSTEMATNPNKCPSCGWHDLAFLVKQFQSEGPIPTGVAQVNHHREDWAHRVLKKIRHQSREINELRAKNESLQQEIAALNAENLGIREQIERYRLSEMEISTDTIGNYGQHQYDHTEEGAATFSLADVELLMGEKLDKFREDLLAQIPQEIGLSALQEKLAILEGKILTQSDSTSSNPALHSWNDYDPDEDSLSAIVIADDDDDSDIQFNQGTSEGEFYPPTIDKFVEGHQNSGSYDEGGELEATPVMENLDQVFPPSSSIPIPPPSISSTNKMDRVDQESHPNFKETYTPNQVNSGARGKNDAMDISPPKSNMSNVLIS